MNDIKRPSQNSRSRSPIIRSSPEVKTHTRDLSRKIEEFERDNYTDDIEEEKEDFYNSRLRVKKPKVKRRMSAQNRVFLSTITIVAFIFLSWTFLFRSATISITPKSKDFVIKDSLIIENTVDNKMYDIAEITKSDKKTIPKTETKKLTTKATGKITIYNNYNNSSQKLIKNTRFQSPTGKIFRITDTVTVPAKVGTVPGSVVATVYADSVGGDYNIEPSKFTIPGFKGSPRFDGFYAESFSAMSGGANGETTNYSDDDIADASSKIEDTLKTAINSELTNIKKEGYIAVQNSIMYTTKNNKTDLMNGKADVYEESVTGQILMIKIDSLENLIAKKVITGYVNESVRVKDINAINISLAKDATLSLTTPINIFVEGSSKIIYELDRSSLQDMLKNKSSAEFNGVIENNYKGAVDSATSSLSPFWVNSYPSNRNKINIVENNI